MKIKLSSYKGIIFDLDDTLIDRKKAFKKVFTKLYMENENINKDTSLDQALNFFSTLSPNNHIDIKKAFTKIKFKFKDFDKNYNSFYEFYYENIVDLIEPYDGIKEFLLCMKEKQINFGVVTNGDDYQYKKIKNTGQDGLFNFVIASEIFGYSKPDIEIYEEALRQLKLTTKDIENVLFIGDNPYTDILGAKNIGFKTAWKKMDFEYPKDLSPPDYVIESYKDLEI